jgi:hypothetical protein
LSKPQQFPHITTDNNWKFIFNLTKADVVMDFYRPNRACYGQSVGEKLLVFKTCPLVNQNKEFNAHD